MESVSIPERIDYVGKFIEIIRRRWKAKSVRKTAFADTLDSVLLDRREKDLIAEQILATLFSTKFVSLLPSLKSDLTKAFFQTLPHG
jgi:hypothetical protein